MVKIDLFSEVKVPIAILGAELDQLTSPEIIKQFEAILSSQSEVTLHETYGLSVM